METKVCSTCERNLSVNEFYVRSDTGTWGTECSACKKARSKRYYRKNTAKCNAAVKRRYEVHTRFNRYGLTLAQYEETLRNQNGVCALCGTSRPGGKGKWHIDHEHVRGYIPGRQVEVKHFRGLLCHQCNVNLGAYEWLLKMVGAQKLASYLVSRPYDAPIPK